MAPDLDAPSAWRRFHLWAIRTLGGADILAGGLFMLVVLADQVILRSGINREFGGLLAGPALLVAQLDRIDPRRGGSQTGLSPGVAPTYCGVMAIVLLNAAILLMILGLDLRRLRPWARWAQVALLTTCPLLAAVHLALMFRVIGFDMVELGYAVPSWKNLLIGPAIVPPALAILLLPGTSLLFSEDLRAARARPAHATPTRRPGARFFTALLMAALALGILTLIVLGPLVDLAWPAWQWSLDWSYS